METLAAEAFKQGPAVALALVIVWWNRVDARERLLHEREKSQELLERERADKLRAFDVVEKNTAALVELSGVTREHSAIVRDLLGMVRTLSGERKSDG